jgi:hypothetical protein
MQLFSATRSFTLSIRGSATSVLAQEHRALCPDPGMSSDIDRACQERLPRQVVGVT